MKWEGEDPIVHEGMQIRNKDGLKKESLKGRDGLRRRLLSMIGEECSREIVIQNAVSQGYKIENIEEVLEELIANGFVTTPKYGILKKA